MRPHRFCLIALLLFPALLSAKEKKPLPDYVLNARTVVVVVWPEGQLLDQNAVNFTARETVERAMALWGKYKIVPDGQPADLVLAVRAGSGQELSPTVKAPTNGRPPNTAGSDGGVRITGAQLPSQPPMTAPGSDPHSGAHVEESTGLKNDTLDVYRGGPEYVFETAPVWRYSAKNSLKAPDVRAVEEFRKAVENSERQQQNKKP